MTDKLSSFKQCGNTCAKISIPMLEVVIEYFLKNRNFNSYDHVMVAFEVTKENSLSSMFCSKLFQIEKLLYIDTSVRSRIEEVLVIFTVDCI